MIRLNSNQLIKFHNFMPNQTLLLVLIIIFSLTGCANVKEAVKVFWGSSTHALDKARVNAAKKSFACTYEQCFEAVLKYADLEVPIDNQEIHLKGMGKEEKPKLGEEKPTTRKMFDIFIKDRQQRHIVVMGVPGAVDTTEVGIFFTEVAGKGTLIEITSLSTAAKVKVADFLFAELEKTFAVLL